MKKKLSLIIFIAILLFSACADNEPSKTGGIKFKSDVPPEVTHSPTTEPSVTESVQSPLNTSVAESTVTEEGEIPTPVEQASPPDGQVSPTITSGVTQTATPSLSIPEELKEPIDALESKDPETAFSALSYSLKEELPLSDLKLQEEWLESIESVEPINDPQENPDGTVTVLIEVHFKDGLEPLQSEVTLIKEGEDWKILSTEIYYGPP